MTRTIAFHGDPFAVFKKFYGKPGLFFLDSSRPGADAQYSYLGFSPFKMIKGRDLRVLKKEFQKYRRAHSNAIFTGGAVGYLGYDGGFYFGLYDQVLAFDHRWRKLMVYAPDRRKISDILHLLGHGPAHINRGQRPIFDRSFSKIKIGRCPLFKSNFNKPSYTAAVCKALDHIRRGDIYQINLSRKVEVEIKNARADALAIYGALRAHSPSPFAAYFDDGRQIILSSSPERFLKLSGGIAQVKPMKGTRPRGATKTQDAKLKKDLCDSSKEIAELLMVTDLERNDLGRVCAYGSVAVKAMRTIETYKNVFQATATIEGKLRRDCDAFDLLNATFPSGSVTGCPKIEAMKLIGKLEGTRRGLYTGALGYISFGGNMDFSVLIRTLFVQKNKINFHVGGGIVADSDPAAEYKETCVKARGMEAALAEVFNG